MRRRLTTGAPGTLIIVIVLFLIPRTSCGGRYGKEILDTGHFARTLQQPLLVPLLFCQGRPGATLSWVVFLIQEITFATSLFRSSNIGFVRATSCVSLNKGSVLYILIVVHKDRLRNDETILHLDFVDATLGQNRPWCRRQFSLWNRKLQGRRWCNDILVVLIDIELLKSSADFASGGCCRCLCLLGIARERHGTVPESDSRGGGAPVLPCIIFIGSTCRCGVAWRVLVGPLNLCRGDNMGALV